MRVGNNAPQNVWTWDMRCRISNPVSFREMCSMADTLSPRTPHRSPDRFLSSAFDDPVTGKKFDHSHSNIHHSSRLPEWLGYTISTTLGINTDRKNSSEIIATILHMLTIGSGLCYGACGLFFNFYDTMSSLTRTTVLVSVASCIIGMYWILLGIYSHTLAARLFANSRMVECIRLHSKTFMKVNVVIVIAVLATTVIVLNLYSNTYILGQKKDNVTHIYHANCPSIGLAVTLCQVYYVSKIVYSLLSLCWNLMVAAICLSVCRTLTIGIRRFMRELNIDSQIYEEYQMLQANYLNPRHTEEKEITTASWSIWDDDIKTFEEDGDFQHSSNRENFLKSIRIRRKKNSTCLDTFIEASLNSGEEQRFEEFSDEFLEYADRPPVHLRDITDSFESVPVPIPEPPCDDVDRNRSAEKKGLDDSQENEEGQEVIGVPIMSNQDLLFMYFKLMRRLAATSRLLQRWISSWLIFVILWCSMLIIYWTSHAASLVSIMQFLLPLVTVALMTSAYAEVNFEGERVIKCILPTEERMSVIYYFHNSHLELKIFSFVMTYNVLVTALAGVALTIASRIIIDQFSS